MGKPVPLLNSATAALNHWPRTEAHYGPLGTVSLSQLRGSRCRELFDQESEKVLAALQSYLRTSEELPMSERRPALETALASAAQAIDQQARRTDRRQKADVLDVYQLQNCYTAARQLANLAP